MQFIKSSSVQIFFNTEKCFTQSFLAFVFPDKIQLTDFIKRKLFVETSRETFSVDARNKKRPEFSETKKRTGNCQFSNFWLMNTFGKAEQYGDTMKPWINFYCGEDEEREAIKPELLKNAQTNIFNMQNPNKSTHTQAGGGKTSENGNLFTHTQSFPRELDERFNSPTFWSEVFFLWFLFCMAVNYWALTCNEVSESWQYRKNQGKANLSL